ncbi:MAG: hypothetical protein HYR91_02800 [Flavobacteriia bacterium]|nr:hypothetical protein [Flavobacteriia bacterium]
MKRANGYLKKNFVRVFAYLFCGFLLWYGFDTLTNSLTIPKDKLRGIGGIVASCVYLIVDIRN